MMAVTINERLRDARLVRHPHRAISPIARTSRRFRASQGASRNWIDREVQRASRASRIVLAGFSQGAAIALQTGLRQAEPLAGLIALSGYLPWPTG